MPGAHRRRRCLSWARLALWAEAASLALWMASSPSVDVRAAMLLAVGLALSAATVGALTGPPARRDLLSWALLLHRCRLPYAFPPSEDTLVANSSLPAPARLAWVLLFKSGWPTPGRCRWRCSAGLPGCLRSRWAPPNGMCMACSRCSGNSDIEPWVFMSCRHGQQQRSMV